MSAEEGTMKLVWARNLREDRVKRERKKELCVRMCLSVGKLNKPLGTESVKADSSASKFSHSDNDDE